MPRTLTDVPAYSITEYFTSILNNIPSNNNIIFLYRNINLATRTLRLSTRSDIIVASKLRLPILDTAQNIRKRKTTKGTKSNV